MARTSVLIVCALLVSLASNFAQAQVARPPLDRPIERPFEPEPQPRPQSEAETSPRLTSPPSPSEATRPPDADREREASEGERLLVRSVRFIGNTAIDDSVLQAAARPFLERRLDSADLRELLVALSRVYLDAGYVNSGATLPSQQLVDGVLEIAIVEGGLGAVEIVGARAYRPGVLARRLERSIPTPLRVSEVERALRRLERDPRIERLDARMRSTETRGVAALRVRIEEANPFWTEFELGNHAPPSVGTLSGRAAAGHDNPLGLGDRFYIEGEKTEGLWRVLTGYEIPIGPFGTTLGFETRQSRADIVQPPFDAIDVESDTQSYAAILRQPVWRGLVNDVAIGLIGEHRRGRTSLLGLDAPLSPGSDGGRIRLSLVRPFVDWTRRGRDTAFALRSIASFGLDTPAATKSPGKTPDGRFFAWLGQARAVYRHPGTQIELHGRLDLQLSDSALLPLEQFAVGGPDTVRGIPRNTLVRDQGLALGLEARLPAWIDAGGTRRVELIAFGDLGRAWNRDRVTPGKRTLSSLGLGLRLRPVPPATLDVQWAVPIRDVERAGSSLQARGLLLSARWRF